MAVTAAQRAADAAAWAEAEKLYADPANKISAIAKLVGLAPIQLSNQAKARGWPLRSETSAKRKPKPKPKPKRAAKPKKPAPSGRLAERESEGATRKSPAPSGRLAERESEGANKKPHKPIVLVRRVYNTIDGELTKLEKQTGVSSQDRERASRALSQMVNSLEKAIEMQREIAKDTSKAGSARNKEALAHAEDLRRAIAERVERLNRKRAPGKRAGGAE